MIPRTGCDGIGKRIYEARQSKGLTLQELGDAIGASKSTVGKYETGIIENISLNKITNLCHALGITPNQLFMWNDEELPTDTLEAITDGIVDKAIPRFTVFRRDEWRKFSKKHSLNPITGYLYLVQIGGLIKIGKSINPFSRFHNLSVTIENYGGNKIGLCAISEEHENYTKNEKLLHCFFANDRIPRTELFKVDFHKALMEIENGHTGISVS